MTYKIAFTHAAQRMLSEIRDGRVRALIAKRIDALVHDPEKQGKPLLGEFIGFRSLRAAGQRYRIIYRVENALITVIVVALGIRKEGDRRDIYELARKLVRLGLLKGA